MSVLLVLCALLIVAGGVSLLAASMGNPVRIGSLSVPGPEGAVERAVLGVVGAVCVAAVLPVVLMNRGPAGEPFAVANATSTPEPPAVTSSGPTPSPTPPAGPSAVAAAPGVPSVTSIAVSQDAATGCVRTFLATVHISTGPVTVRYRVYVNGAVVGDPNRTRSVNGAGGRPLDTIPVTATHSGVWTVRIDVLGPNPTILTGTAAWTAPAACNPAPPPTTTPPPPPPPTLSVSVPVVTGPAITDSCANVTIGVTATLTVGSAPTGLNVTYTIFVGVQTVGPSTSHVDGSAEATGSAPMPLAVPGPITVQITATAPGVPDASASTPYTIVCTP